MAFGWLRRRSSAARKESAIQSDRATLIGYELHLRRRDTEQEGAMALKALAQRCEVGALDEDGLRFRVVVDDAYDPDEAVVRLASILDEIDRSWEGRFDWPKASGPAVRGSESDEGSSR